MQQELIEMLEETIQYVEVWNAHDQGIIDKAEALVEKAKKSAKEPAVPQGEPVAFAWRAKKGQPSAWQVCFDLKQADDAEVLAKTEIRFMSWTTPAAPSQPVTLTDSWPFATPHEVELRLGHQEVVLRFVTESETQRACDAIIAALREKEQAK